ncbi:hypothetical protein ACIQ9P_08200 [Kitasatospora sp. NPDC094019]|uniref:terpene synthase family protein n=1 Tax=Kitasatospora sp. NPDC094019 TaxID=3364091 RepID=UPI0037F9DBB5
MTRFPFPYPLVVAPVAEIERARCENLRWFHEQGLLDGTDSAPRYERWNVALLAGLMYPHARGADLVLATHVLGLLFLIDDRFETRLGLDPPRAGRVCDELLAATRPLHDPGGARTPLATAAGRLWDRARTGMPGEWCVRAALAWQEFAAAPAFEAYYRRAGAPAPWELFRILRRFSGGADFLICLAERVEHYTVPALVHHSPQIQRMLLIAAEVPVFTNDANSLDKEGDREVNNLVTATRHYQGLSTDRAIGHVRAVVARHVAEFAVLTDSLYLLCDGLGLDAEQRQGVGRYVGSMQYMMRGYHEWELRTARYLDAQRRAATDPPAPGAGAQDPAEP